MSITAHVSIQDSKPLATSHESLTTLSVTSQKSTNVITKKLVQCKLLILLSLCQHITACLIGKHYPIFQPIRLSSLIWLHRWSNSKSRNNSMKPCSCNHIQHTRFVNHRLWLAFKFRISQKLALWLHTYQKYNIFKPSMLKKLKSWHCITVI